MNNLQKRMLLFLLGCVVVRLSFVYFAKNANEQQLKYGSIVACVLALSWFYLYYFDLRKTGPEVFGDKIWWNNLRPIHATLYLTFAYMAISNQYMKYSWIPLLIDISFGLISFLFHHFGN